ncbi:cation:proton antiporter regulatory subunit [Paenibacillus sp. GCM10027626]|uniref:cation:proton antiporter regulatory subunit n=1 Tax=Paenibacillus sp. GCM10027626 TaxID=3273411 RepID=UPI00363CE3BD
MNIWESDLPGIGKKFQLHTRGGDKLVLVVHDDGRRECFHYDHDDLEESISMVTLDDDEARVVAAVLGGVTYRPRALESVEMALDDLVIEWYRIESGYYAAGKTIGDLNVRQRTGATIIALIGPQKNNRINPGPEADLTPESTLVVAGDRSQQKMFKQILMDGCDS